MPDVNWECSELREELYKIARWWLERGVDGFRIDAISHIKKKPGLPDLPNPKQLEFVSSFDYHMNVEGIEEFLAEFKRETYGNLDVVTVGEANGVGADQAIDWVDEEHGLFNMIFQFEGTNLWEKTLGSLDGKHFKREIDFSLFYLTMKSFSFGIKTYYDEMAKKSRENWLECFVS